jgi:hypothetical protein
LGTLSNKILQFAGRTALPKTDSRFNFDQATTITKQIVSQVPKWLNKPFVRSWPFWAVITCTLCAGMTYVSIGMLLNPKAVPNCPEVFLPMASASLRVYCGQAAASKQTLKDLATAFSFVKDIPKDDPLRGYIDSNIQKWSVDLLRLAEGSYQQGNIDEAVSMAKLVPADVPAYKRVSKRIKHWQTTWKEAESIYQRTENLLRNSNWVEASQVASKLNKLGNDYWSNVKYQDLTNKVSQAEKDSAQLDQAYKLLKSNSIKDLLAAIAIARKIDQQSYALKEAQQLIAKSAKQMLDIAKIQLRQNNWKAVQEITQQIPVNPEIQAELQDVRAIGDAQAAANNNTISDLEIAIGLAQAVKPASTVYGRAQELLTSWQLEVQDLAYLQRANNLASTGNVGGLEAAIKEASQIPANNPRAKEAAATISGWRRQIQVVQDQPYMDAADQLASTGNAQALQQAIAQLRQLPPGRALYPDAQQKINRWTNQIQKMQDAPILENAELQARNGNIPAAIATANQIGAGRALYGQAQARIGEWSGDTQARQRLSDAQQLANEGTPEALLGAIDAVKQISANSSAYQSARAASNKWSGELFRQAQAAASYDLGRAISIAQVVPAGSTSYAPAQRAIQQWENSQNDPNVGN